MVRTRNQQPNPALPRFEAVAQRTPAAVPATRKLPVAPPVYRPQPVPKVLQTKKAVAPPLSGVQIGGAKRPAAPSTNKVLMPAQRPQVAAKLLQPKKHPNVNLKPGRLEAHLDKLQPNQTTIQAAASHPRPIAPPRMPRHIRPVIQAKGNLKVIKTADIPKSSEVRRELHRDYIDSRYVDMYWRGVTEGQPLYSDSFGNCLAVIIHNQNRDYGALMHISPAAIGATDTDTVIYAVNQELKKIVSWNSYAEGMLELFLWKGITLTPIGNNKLAKNFSYSEYLAKKHKGRFTKIIDMLDKEGFTPEFAVLYVPKKGVIYLIDQATEEELNKLKRDTQSQADADFAEIEVRKPGYYQQRQEAKQVKRERIEKFIIELGHLDVNELNRLLKKNVGPQASEELEKAAIYLLQKKQNPQHEPPFPKIYVY